MSDFETTGYHFTVAVLYESESFPTNRSRVWREEFVSIGRDAFETHEERCAEAVRVAMASSEHFYYEPDKRRVSPVCGFVKSWGAIQGEKSDV